MAANCATTRVSWQEKLNGGRTAWSSSVSIQGSSFSARYFYAGEFINNAKEDAAEVAFTQLNSQPRLSTVLPGQLYAQQK
ncbi:uncharacterized protein GIQ15_06128 [Arthroderma uncinatum]|uniref:uncharacterized protein n=1 Tax=Arthroderma uncinatum TaxID=74035 RepID=UPI00144AB6DD|nr:uncharacterized protein GIQ15_06128 [Arthroderma uncinatum]KAF3480781.1 hypothetical protein GIQ15_06128 [Arthroderma uncinatum]